MTSGLFLGEGDGVKVCMSSLIGTKNRNIRSKRLGELLNGRRTGVGFNIGSSLVCILISSLYIAQASTSIH